MANISGTINPDILTGTIAADLIEGLESDDILYGFDGSDTLLGGVGDDILYGGSGNDTMDGGAGEDLFYGQSGLDTVSYASALDGLTLNMADNSLSTGDASGDFYLSVESFVLTSFNDTFIGNAFINEAHGGGGNDLLQGFGGNDLLFGDDGNDTLIGGAGADQLTGGQGSDQASYADATTAITLDFLDAASNSGDAAGDTFTGIEAATMTSFGDRVTLSSVFRKAYGGDGNDTLTGNIGTDTVVGGNGNDSLLGDAASDLLQGDDGDDTLNGGSGDDTLLGGSGNDSLIGGLGADVMNGGDGDDLAVYDAKVTLDFLTPSNSIGQALGDSFVGIEGIMFTGGAQSKYVGGSGAITVIVAGASVKATAGTGAEHFVAPFGTLSVSYATTAQATTFTVGDDGLVGARGATGDTLTFVSELILTNKADIYDLTGFNGTSGAPATVFAANGNDTLVLSYRSVAAIDTGAGNDTVTGLMGSGTLTLGKGTDTVDINVSSGSFMVNPLSVSGGDGVDTITIRGFAALLDVKGDAGADVIDLQDSSFFSSNYSVQGGEGDDDITVNAATISVLGGIGNDTINAFASNFISVLSGEDGNDHVTVTALAGSAQGGLGEDTIDFFLIVTGAGGAIADGGAGDDTLTISSIFIGSTLPGNGAEFRGGEGNDALIDTTDSFFVTSSFVFGATWGQDSITGFDDGIDRIVFEGVSGLDDITDLTVSGDATQTTVTFGLNTIRIDGLDVTNFTADDIIFL